MCTTRYNHHGAMCTIYTYIKFYTMLDRTHHKINCKEFLVNDHIIFNLKFYKKICNVMLHCWGLVPHWLLHGFVIVHNFNPIEMNEEETLPKFLEWKLWEILAYMFHYDMYFYFIQWKKSQLLTFIIFNVFKFEN